MDVKKCDRCGEIIESCINDKEARVMFIFKIDEAYDGYRAVRTKADLCGNCAKDLNKWLKGM